MNQKRAKHLRSVAKIIANDKFDWKRVYKALKKMEGNRDAYLARLKIRANKFVELPTSILEGADGSNT